MELQRNRCLEDLEDPAFVLQPDAALLRAGPAELRQLFAAPFRLDPPGRDHRHQRDHAMELLCQSVAEDVVALQFGVPPDPRLFAQELCDADLQCAAKIRDPTFVAFGQADVVEVCVADESVAVKFHDVLCFRSSCMWSAILNSSIAVPGVSPEEDPT
jgi:hypothetical protein